MCIPAHSFASPLCSASRDMLFSNGVLWPDSLKGKLPHVACRPVPVHCACRQRGKRNWRVCPGQCGIVAGASGCVCGGWLAIYAFNFSGSVSSMRACHPLLLWRLASFLTASATAPRLVPFVTISIAATLHAGPPGNPSATAPDAVGPQLNIAITRGTPNLVSWQCALSWQISLAPFCSPAGSCHVDVYIRVTERDKCH